MADLVETMVRSADTAQSWHGKENVIPPDAPFDGWFEASGLNYAVRRSEVMFADGAGVQAMPSRHVLWRSDTSAPLAVVGEDYRVVQPRQVLEFFRDLCAENHLKMDTAGVLAGGRRVWALASTGQQAVIGNADVLKQYVLLATSYDTTMATVAKHTSVRVVCNNTLSLAYNNNEAAIKVNHCTEFDQTKVQLQMGLLDEQFAAFTDYADEMHRAPYSIPTAARWYAELLKEHDVSDEEFDELQSNRVLRGLMNSFNRSPGAEATLWGVVNGCTAFVDHVRGRGYDTRMNSAWFGQGDLLKRKAWEKARQVIDAANGKTILLTA